MKNSFSIDGNNLKITIGKSTHEFGEDDYIVQEDGKIILRHCAIISLAKVENIQVGPPTLIHSFNQYNYIVQRTASNTNNEVEYGIGESIKENLKDQISKEYPFITADTRAYDRAVLTLLGFSGKVYSDIEIAVTKPIANKAVPEMPKAISANDTDMTPTENVDLNMDAMEEPPKSENTDVATKAPEETAKSEKTKKETSKKAGNEEKPKDLPVWWDEADEFGEELNPDAFVITQGRYKSNEITANGMYEIDKTSVEWFANKSLGSSEEFNKNIITCRRCIKQKIA